MSVVVFLYVCVLDDHNDNGAVRDRRMCVCMCGWCGVERSRVVKEETRGRGKTNKGKRDETKRNGTTETSFVLSVQMDEGAKTFAARPHFL